MFSFPDPLSIISLAKYIHFPHIFPICYILKSVYYLAYLPLIFFQSGYGFPRTMRGHAHINQKNTQHLFSAIQICTLSSIAFSFTYSKICIHIQILPLHVSLYADKTNISFLCINRDKKFSIS